MSYERMRDGYGDSFLLRSGSDAVDGFSTGAEVPWMRVLSRPPRFGGIASDYISDALAGHSFRNALPSVSLASTLNVVAPLGT